MLIVVTLAISSQKLCQQHYVHLDSRLDPRLYIPAFCLIVLERSPKLWDEIQKRNSWLEGIRPHSLNCLYQLPSSVLCQWCNTYNYLVTSSISANVLPELSSVYMLQWHDNDDSQSSMDLMKTSIINRIYTEWVQELVSGVNNCAIVCGWIKGAGVPIWHCQLGLPSAIWE